MSTMDVRSDKQQQGDCPGRGASLAVGTSCGRSSNQYSKHVI